MSEENGPNMHNLRDFRKLKKPTLVHHTTDHDTGTSPDDSSDCSPVFLTKPKKCLPMEDSDSESPFNFSTTNGQFLSDFFDKRETSRTEKVVVIRNDIEPPLGSDDVNAGGAPGPNGATTTRPLAGKVNSVYISRPKKTEAIIEKEKQMRFLVKKFPTIDTMAIHDILSKHKFSIDGAIKELVTKEKAQACETNSQDYEMWKHLDNDNQKLSEAPTPASFNVASSMNCNKKRQLVAISNETKKKAKRLRTEAVSDDSDNERANHYKDTRVFDSDEDSDVEITNELTKDKRRVLEFFQTATVNELQLMSSCSKKKADAIIECRPFDNWIDLHTKLTENKNLSPSLLNAAHEVLATRHNIQSLMVKCRNLANQMERAIAAGASVKQQPSILSPGKILTNYQMVGLNWLATLHSQRVNGILADEMGLGKTIQVIAFLAHLKEIGASKEFPHLVIVPSSTLDNWRFEFEKWCPALKVFMYYGTTEERKMYRIEYWSKGNLSNYDVILTTYTMLNTPEEKKMFKITQMNYVIFDEAHMLKNMNTRRYENLIRIKALNRILLTGTPLQNNLLELMSLLIFVMPSMFAGKSDDLKSLFQKTAKKQNDEDDLPTFERSQIKQAKDIMKPFVLRRLKRDVLQDLPKKTDQLVEVELAPTQLEQYQNLVYHFQNVGKETKEGSVMTYNATSMMTDLRKLSNHPLLLRYHYQIQDIREMAKILAVDPMYKDTVEQYIVDDLLYMSDFEIHTLCKQFKRLEKFSLPENLVLTSGKFLHLDKKLKELKEGGHRVLIFSQYVIMLDVMEEYLQLRKHTYLRLDGSTPVTTRQELIDRYTNEPEIFLFLLSTRAGGLGINLTAADTVIIHDIDFNPYNDKQAEDRCHRIGQTKPVRVYRLISRGTLEEGMWQMNRDKLKLEKEVTMEESENPDVKSVVRLLSSALGLDSSKMNNLVSAEGISSPTKHRT